MKFYLALILFFASHLILSQDVKSLLKKSAELHNSKPDTAYKLCLDAEKLAIKNSDSIGLANCKLCEVRYLLLKNRLEEAATEIEISHQIFSKFNNRIGLGRTYISMSNIAGRIKKDDLEIKYLENAYNIFDELRDTTLILKTLTNLSLNYTHLGKFEQAEKALEKLDKMSLGMPPKEYYYLNQNWGIFYKAKGDFQSALLSFNSAKQIAESLKMTDSKATILLLISQNYILMGEFDEALKSVNQSYKVASENDLTVEKLEALEVLNQIYEEKGDIENAYKTFKEFVSIKDTIYNLQKINNLNEYEKKIALSEKEKIIANQKLDIEMQNVELLKDKYQFYVLFAVILLISISVIMLIVNLKSKQKANQIISKQKEEVEKQKQIVDNKNFQILSSITYAKRIQEAILPQEKIVKEYLEKSFVFYKAKDIVSGDFYWMEQVGNKILFAAVDCTGHGVPGAFMSIVGNSGLNKAVRELKLTQPSLILDALNLHLVKSFHINSADVKDGMDIAICLLDLETNILEYAGAFNPLYILKSESEEIEIIKGDKQAIGSAKDLYQNNIIQLSEGDLIYIFTDGFADQFGGQYGKKFGYKQFREMLVDVSKFNMKQQREMIEQKFQLWKGVEEQIDDICVIGVRV